MPTAIKVKDEKANTIIVRFDILHRAEKILKYSFETFFKHYHNYKFFGTNHKFKKIKTPNTTR